MATDFGPLQIGDPVDVEELKAKPQAAGRQPSERDIALISFVEFVGQPENKGKAFPIAIEGKPATMRQASMRAIERAGAKGKVFLSSRDGKFWFSQERLSNRGRTAK